MDLSFAVDLISDLNLTVKDTFDWDGKATSLFCIVAGNVSSDHAIVDNVLTNLSQHYRGVLFIDGSLENQYISSHDVIESMRNICRPLPNVVYLHNHVVILNGIAFVGANGWYAQDINDTNANKEKLSDYHNEDMTYLTRTIRNLQKHHDANRITLITSSLPSQQVSFRDPTLKVDDPMGLIMCLASDSDHKVDHWLFGSYKRSIDYTFNARRYVNNPKMHDPYYPKKVIIS